MADLNPKIGTDPGKVRPVVVAQINFLNNIHPRTVVCPITTNVIQNSKLLRVHLKKGEAGLNQNSDILIDQVRAIDNRRTADEAQPFEFFRLRYAEVHQQI